MKKHLLPGFLVLVAISAYPQNAKTTKPTGIVPTVTEKINFTEGSKQNNTSSAFTGPIKSITKAINPGAKTSSINQFTGSMNVFGYIVSTSRPLQYNPALNAVSFVARKSSTYTASSNSNSGTIVGLYSTDMGATWNETCLWANASNLARYPQGGIYNPSGNTNINNAYLVGSGPITPGSGWSGNWYASKQITTPGNTTAGTDMQSMINASLPGSMRKHDFSRYAFTVIDGGLARSMGLIVNDISATTNSGYGFRGASLIKGAFSAGSFVWSIDSMIPATTMHSNFTPSTADDYKNLTGEPLQAWNENGTIGYVVLMGSRASETLTATRVAATGGYQPIVYKTTNSGASWSLLPAEDFGSMTNFKAVWDRTYPVTTNTNLIVPNFGGSEGWDVVVDANDQLHLGAMVYGHIINHTDSLGYRNVFGTEQYSYPENGPFNYPVYYDFYTKASGGWNYIMVDSMGTEGPSGTSGQPGYASNPWSDGSGAKMAIDARFQMSRTADGSKIFYTWTESDSTIAGTKWNIYPNLKMRGYDVTNHKLTPRIDLTNADLTHSQAAYYHYTSNKAAVSASCYTVPVTITKNSSLDGSLPVNTFFSDNGVLCAPAFSINPNTSSGIGINELQAKTSFDVKAYPNPAAESVTIIVELKELVSGINITVTNTLGQIIKSIKSSGSVGLNEFTLDLNNVSTGVYLYSVTAGNSTVTKKLIVR